MTRPRIAFLGVGWIGRHRMNAILETGLAEACGICEPDAALAAEAKGLAPEAAVVVTFEELLALEPDGVVIATPSALHAEQSIRALETGAAVFCQKPLGRNAAEAAAVVEAARNADRLLGVDLSYRFTDGMKQVVSIVRGGGLGEVFAVDLVFHNAYGPGKPWFFDAALSGGGCVMDLGVHLVDLASWALDFPAVGKAESHLFAGGRPFVAGQPGVEDFCFATLTLATGCVVRLTCSWHLHAGQEAVIAAEFYGTKGGTALRNVGGSFYDFTAHHHNGTSTRQLAGPPDEWGGRAAADWTRRLATSIHFDPEAERFVDVSRALDAIYAASASLD